MKERKLSSQVTRLKHLFNKFIDYCSKAVIQDQAASIVLDNIKFTFFAFSKERQKEKVKSISVQFTQTNVCNISELNAEIKVNRESPRIYK